MIIFAVKRHVLNFSFWCNLFAAVYVDGRFDDECAKVKGCFKVKHMLRRFGFLINSSVSVRLVH